MEQLTYTIESHSGAETIRQMREKVPAVLYKFRDWGNLIHKRSISHQEIYFAHPRNLNDPNDIRVPVRYNIKEIDDPRFFEKIKQFVSKGYPQMLRDSPAFMAHCVDKMQQIRQDPTAYFEKSWQAIRESNIYDIYGVFCVSSDPLNAAMWAYYSANHTGFCVGYDPISIFNYIVCSFGAASYRDKPPEHSFINPISPQDMIHDFVKSEAWKHEKEYRFITLMIQNDLDRIVQLPKPFIKELILGKNMVEQDVQAIVNLLIAEFDSHVSLFQIVDNIQQFGFTKKQINY